MGIESERSTLESPPRTPRQNTVLHFHQEPGVSPPSFTDKNANLKLTWAEEAMSEGEAVARARQHSTARRPGLG